MTPHEYAVHAQELRDALPPLAQFLVAVGLVVVGIAWVWAFSWAERH